MKPQPIYRKLFTVLESAIDFNGHVNNLRYIEWMLAAAQEHSEATGWPMERCISKYGATWVARTHKFGYLHPAFAGDELELRSWIEEARGVRAIRRYEILRKSDGAKICEGESEWIWVDAETLRPRRIPREIAERFR
ncbi:acyl-CoA thioesterase [Nitratifractor sp.]